MKFKINEKKVSKKEAKEYVEKLWGAGAFERRLQEAREYFQEEADNECAWADGFKIYY